MWKPTTNRTHIHFASLLLVVLVSVGVCGRASGQPVYNGPPSGLAPNSFPIYDGTQPLQLPPPPLNNLGPELIPEMQLSAPTPTIESTPEPPDWLWYNPWTWVPRDGWTNSAELGINGTDGNSKSFSFQTGARFKRKTEKHLFEWKLTHNRTQNSGVESQNNALMSIDYERLFKDSPWSWFSKYGMEYDEFKAFDLRINLNTGMGYRWVDTKDLRLSTRFGAGTSREIGGPDDRWVPEAVFGADYDHQVNARNKLLVKFDYFPEWTDFSNYRIVSDMGWEYLLDEKGNLSMKLGANDRYDSTPNGRKPNDINYTFLMLYKF